MTGRGQIDQARLSEAAAWRARLDSDVATDNDWMAFGDWLKTPANAEAARVLDDTIIALDDARKELAAEFSSHTGDNVIHLRTAPASKGSKGRLQFAPWAGLAVAAAAALVFVAVGLQKSDVGDKEYALAAPLDASRTFTLADRSTIILNRGASVRVKFGADQRLVVLDKGEAAFTVVHDSERPFLVKTGDETIRDIGTVFDVARAARRVTVTVSSGIVSFEAKGVAPLRLVAGEQARLDREKSTLVKASVNADDVFAWRQGRLVYHDAPLAEIADDLNRYSDGTSVTFDQSVATLRFSGTLTLDSPEIMASRLAAMMDITAEKSGDRVTFRRDR